MNENLKAEYNGLSVASFVFGILAVLSSFVLVLTPFFAPLAITFAWLSRGNKKMNWQAVAGNTLAILSILISFVVCGVLIFFMFDQIVKFLQGNSQSVEQILQQFQNLI